MMPPRPFSAKTYVMGVLNVTPDSFSDGGRFFDRKKAIGHALEMASDGADLIDVGGESTRPNSREVSVEEELERVIPVIGHISKRIKISISVDTRKSKVAEEAIKAGAQIVNDVSGLNHDPKMGRTVAKYGARLIVMHMRGEPRTMQVKPTYKDLIGEIIASLRKSIAVAKRAGVDEDKIIIDPGIGFGKTVEHNLEILRRLDEFKVLKKPLCIGTSRKSFIGKVLEVPDPDFRLAGTLATCVIAIMKGANIIRVHDVKEAAEASRMADSILRVKAA